MQSQQRLKATKIIVLLSIMLSMGSIATIKLGWGEIYPFYFWKLYTQPLGWENSEEDHRIYASNCHTCPYVRLQTKATYSFTIDEYIYTLNRNVYDYLGDKNIKSFERLKAFIKHVEPEFIKYKIVKESYRPLDFKAKNTSYDTLTVITF